MAIDRGLEQGFVQVAEEGAIAAAKTMGLGKRKYSDQVAVEAMREALADPADERPNRHRRRRAGQGADALGG